MNPLEYTNMEFQVLDKRKQLCKIAILSCCLVLACITPASGQSLSITAVVDGERIILSDGTRIKLAGVDAPEFHPSTQLSQKALLTGKAEEAVRRQGAIAFAYLRVLAVDRAVQVQYEPGPRLDHEAYKPAYVHVLDQRGRIAYTLNSRMIEDGYASVDTKTEVTMAGTYSVLERKAREKGKGLWATNPPYIMSVPGERHSSEGASLQSACAINPACVWMGEGYTGMWRSRTGRKCPCSDQ